jgi:hypothetical protein
MAVSRCGTLAVAFLPQVWPFPVVFLWKKANAAEARGGHPGVTIMDRRLMRRS